MKYTFNLENKGVFYLKPLLEEEVNEARLLCDECVGENLYGAEEIASAVGAADRFFYLLKSEAGEPVGYIYYYLTDPEDIAKYAKLDAELFRKVYSLTDKMVGKIQSVGLKAERHPGGSLGKFVKMEMCSIFKLFFLMFLKNRFKLAL